MAICIDEVAYGGVQGGDPGREVAWLENLLPSNESSECFFFILVSFSIVVSPRSWSPKPEGGVVCYLILIYDDETLCRRSLIDGV